MPKSPTTRLGIPRYEDSENAAFSFQVNAISEAVDAKAELRLVNRPLEAGAVAVAQDRIIFKGAGGPYTATLPVPAAEARIAVLNETATKECKVKVNTGKIYGDFVTGATEITLSVGQHVELVSDGTNWFIVAGEPKQEASYSAATKVGTSTKSYEVTPSSSRPAVVALTVSVEVSPVLLNILVGGVLVHKLAGLDSALPGAGTEIELSVYVPAGQALKLETVSSGNFNVFSSTLTL
jgi:hypothetical protein